MDWSFRAFFLGWSSFKDAVEAEQLQSCGLFWWTLTSAPPPRPVPNHHAALRPRQGEDLAPPACPSCELLSVSEPLLMLPLFPFVSLFRRPANPVAAAGL